MLVGNLDAKTNIGDVVRVAPNELAFITPEAFNGMSHSTLWQYP